MKTTRFLRNKSKKRNNKNRTCRKKMRGRKVGGDGKNTGLVYILSNESYEDVYLIGETSDTNLEKLLEEHDTESTPYPFEIQFSAVVENSREVFDKICENLTRNNHRVKPGKDFFRCDAATLNQIRRVLNKEFTKDLKVVDDVRSKIASFI